jgi:hypothetical protein
MTEFVRQAVKEKLDREEGLSVKDTLRIEIFQ